MGDGERSGAELDWVEGVPVSRRYADPYYSLHDGWAEAGHVFLGGNDLPARLVSGFHVAELGFGTGLNLLRLVAALEGYIAPIHFTSFEAHPLRADEMAQALDAFPQTAGLRAPLLEAVGAGRTTWSIGGVEVRLIVGDARATLPVWEGAANAWFLDGFAPARNPELWTPKLLAEVARHTAPGGTLATYTAAGDVRRALEAVGFDVTRHAGFARKRHMTTGRLR